VVVCYVPAWALGLPKLRHRKTILPLGQVQVRVGALDRPGGEDINVYKFTSLSLAVLYCSLAVAGQEKHYRGKPFHDSVYHGGAQKIPGRVQCAYYDLGGEGVAYHTPMRKTRAVVD